jgi:hypothetical protein
MGQQLPKSKLHVQAHANVAQKSNAVFRRMAGRGRQNAPTTLIVNDSLRSSLRLLLRSFLYWERRLDASLFFSSITSVGAKRKGKICRRRIGKKKLQCGKASNAGHAERTHLDKVVDKENGESLRIGAPLS